MKYKHALFLNPYVDGTATSIMGLFPPTGLEYVASSAKDLADKVTLLDLRHDPVLSDTDKLIDFIRAEIDIICVAIGWDYQFQAVCNLLNLMPDGIPLVVGGFKATEQADALFTLCPKIDIVVRGEGEETIKEILQNKPPQEILGISYRSNGSVINNENRPLQGVGCISPPDRNLRRTKYHMRLNGIKVMNVEFDSVLGARGCPYNCKFCTFSLNPLGQKRTYAARNASCVVDEIEEISADMILFSDDNFCSNVKLAEEICDLLIERNIQKRFIVQVRVELAKYPKLMDKMVKAGFKVLLLGIESPHDYILANLSKGFNSAKVRTYFETFNKYPFYYHGYFIYGNIGETEEEMMYISKFADEIGLDSITFQKLRIERFSPLREIAQNTPGYHVTDRGELYSDNYSHAALKQIARWIKFNFYTTGRMIKIVQKLIKIKLLTPGEFFYFLAVSPRLLVGIIARELHKKRLGNSLKRIFIKNHNPARISKGTNPSPKHEKV